MLIRARRPCPTRWVLSLAGVVQACVLACAVADPASASGPLSGQIAAAQSAAAAVETTAAPAVTPSRRAVAVTRAAAARVSPAVRTRVVEPVANAAMQAAEPPRRAVAAPVRTTSHRRPAQRAGGTTARAPKRPATSTMHNGRDSSPEPAVAPSAVTVADGAVDVEAASARVPRPRTVDRRHETPRAALRAVPSTPVSGPGPAPGGAAASASSAAGSAAGAMAVLSLLLHAFAAPRLGGLLRLAASRAPLAPLAAVPERPG
jgi:hypothetical protein